MLLKRTRVLLADDHEAMLDRVKGLLEKEFQVVGTVRDGQAALEAVAELNPEVLILDISMPVLTGIEVAVRLKLNKSDVRIVFLTVHEDPDFACEALATGARGFVVKPRLVTDLPVAIKDVLAGRSFVSPSISLEDDN
jgi:DNA-binding NarL/FixJ family response regulator